jgi:hypothetical protein
MPLIPLRLRHLSVLSKLVELEMRLGVQEQQAAEGRERIERLEDTAAAGTSSQVWTCVKLMRSERNLAVMVSGE